MANDGNKKFGIEIRNIRTSSESDESRMSGVFDLKLGKVVFNDLGFEKAKDKPVAVSFPWGTTSVTLAVPSEQAEIETEVGTRLEKLTGPPKKVSTVSKWGGAQAK